VEAEARSIARADAGSRPPAGQEIGTVSARRVWTGRAGPGRAARALAFSVLILAQPGVASAIDVLAQFEGLASSDNTIPQTPPDDNLAVGPGHIMEMVNSQARIMNKAGGVIQTVALETFFGVDPGFDSSDPQVIYDAPSGRWFASYFQSKTGASSVILAVSTSSDPSTGFCLYRLGNPTSETFEHDQPWLGVSDDKVGISYNAFTGNSFLGAGYYVVNKSQLLTCTPSISVARIPPDPNLFSLRATPSLSSTSTLYLIENDNTFLTMIAVDGVPGVGAGISMTTRILPIRSWIAPPNAPQPGSAVLLDTGDERITSVAWQNGSLWLAGNESCVPQGDTRVRSCLRFIEVRTDAATVRQDFTVATAGRYDYYPAVRQDSAANLITVFTESSSTVFASVRISGRLFGDPLNTLQPSQLLRAGTGAQTQSLGRTGDYSGAALDPVDPSTVWVTGEYIRTTALRDWGTYIAQLRFNVVGLAAAVLPSSRSVQVNATATAFATILASGTGQATGCAIAPLTSVPGSFVYQTTDPITNQLTGSPNTPATIQAGMGQTFLIAFTPTLPFAPTDVQLAFSCANTGAAPIISGVNSLLLSASATPAPDIVALSATATNNGILTLSPMSNVGVFAVAAVNVGSAGLITASADTGDVALPVAIGMCQTDPSTSRCISTVGPSVTTQIGTGETPTFAVFVQAIGPVPFDPASNRIFVRFRDAGAATRGSTSVAVRSQ
jgi:hypothetical protein